MPRKSIAWPPSTCERCQVWPLSKARRITPFEPQTHTATLATPLVFLRRATLTPRRLLAKPLVCTFHHWAWTAAPRNRENSNDGKARIARILTDGSRQAMLLLPSENCKRNVCFLRFTGLDFRGLSAGGGNHANHEKDFSGCRWSDRRAGSCRRREDYGSAGQRAAHSKSACRSRRKGFVLGRCFHALRQRYEI